MTLMLPASGPSGKSTTTILQLHPCQHIGNGELQSFDLNSLAGHSVCSGINPAAFKQRICELLHYRFSLIPHASGHAQHQRQTLAGQHRGSPQHGELPGGGFREFQVSGA